MKALITLVSSISLSLAFAATVFVGPFDLFPSGSNEKVEEHGSSQIIHDHDLIAQNQAPRSNKGWSGYSPAYAPPTPTMFDADACIIDLGITTSYNAGLAPYGLVYDLVKNFKYPVYWG